MRNTIITSLVLATACLAATPSFAAEAKLTWKDLDLTTEAGRTELDRRIDVAAEQVCSREAVTGTLITRRATPSCLADAHTAIKARIAAKTSQNRVAANAGHATAEAR